MLYRWSPVQEKGGGSWWRGEELLVRSKRLLTDPLITPSFQRKEFTAQVGKISIPAWWLFLTRSNKTKLKHCAFRCFWDPFCWTPLFRAVPKCLKHPAGPGQKLIHGGAIWVVEVWLQLFWIQLPQLNSFLPQPKYKSLCDWSTQNVHHVLPALSKSRPAYHFPHYSASNIWFCEPYPHRIEMIRPNLLNIH